MNKTYKCLSLNILNYFKLIIVIMKLVKATVHCIIRPITTLVVKKKQGDSTEIDLNSGSSGHDGCC
jgi:hypothetical protein